VLQVVLNFDYWLAVVMHGGAIDIGIIQRFAAAVKAASEAASRQQQGASSLRDAAKAEAEEAAEEAHEALKDALEWLLIDGPFVCGRGSSSGCCCVAAAAWLLLRACAGMISLPAAYQRC
jgi:glutathione S-transferase